MHLIHAPEVMAKGAAWLAARDPVFARLFAEHGVPPVRRAPLGFSGLLQAIVGQQLSTKAAGAIWQRLDAAGLTTPEALLEAPSEALAAAGLSGSKIRFARALAAARLDFAKLHHLPDDALIEALVALPGIGRWTAEIYAMFALGRPDIFPAADLGLQEAARAAFALSDRPSEPLLRQRAKAWSPWRSVAANMLWAYRNSLRKPARAR